MQLPLNFLVMFLLLFNIAAISLAFLPSAHGSKVPENVKSNAIEISEQLITQLHLGIEPNIVYEDFGEFASAPACNGGSVDGNLYIGADMLLSLNEMGDWAIRLVLMHEIGHLLQFNASASFRNDVCSGSAGNLKSWELLADFAAGHAMANLEGSEDSIKFIRAIGGLSDYMFVMSDHHGTNNERINAYNFGQFAAVRGKPLDMKVLIKNKEVFMQLIGGPRLKSIKTQQDLVNYYHSSIEKIYR